MLTQHALAWLMTYLLHSTLLLGLAWLASKPLSRWSVAAEETVWKLALVGALFTATLQLAAGWEPMAGRWSLTDPAPAVQASEATLPVPSVPVRVRPEPSRIAETPAPLPPSRLSVPSVPALALGVWACGALLLLAGYVHSFAHLGRRLKRRPQVVGGNLHSQLRTLAAQAGFAEDIRLTCSSRVPVPLALGLRQPEICVPPKALAGLTEEQQEGMLAHELAHLARRDPLWLVISHALACVFFFQPLNWVARRRLREISEMLSDEWAASRTGRPLSLAGCLAEVAGWSSARRPLPVPGMADRPSHLAQRIRRLLDGRSPENPARRIWLGAAMVVLLIAVAAAAPAVSAARKEAAGKPEVKALQADSSVSEEGEHDVAEENDLDTDTDDGVDVDVDGDEDVKIDYDDMVEDVLASVEDIDDMIEDSMAAVDLDGLDATIDASLGSMDAALEALDVELEGLSRNHALTEEEQEKLEEDIERMNERIERSLQPRLEHLSREITEKVHRDLPTLEMRKLAEEMKDLAERMRPSQEEMARLHALVDEEMRKHRANGEFSREERQKIAREAREMAQRMRPTEEQRKAMEDLRRQHHELAEKYRAEHHDEIEKATREMREEIQREMDAAREEMRRSMDQRRQTEREERRERLDRDRERDRDLKRDKDENGKEKPPKMVLKMDLLTGKLELVPDEPGC